MIRLFVALRPPRTIRDALIDRMTGVAGARWQDDEQLHITTRFIGEVDAHQADDIVAALGSVQAPAPRVALNGVGTFGRPGRIESLWAGLSPHPPLAALHRKVDQALVAAGIPRDRRAYLPHVTLARVPRAIGGMMADSPAFRAWLAHHAGLASPVFSVTHLTLYESHLGRDGATYEPVARWPLAPAAGTPDALTGSP